MPDMDWTPEAIARMAEMRAAGMGSGPISKALGCTRNAVIGKCKREGIPSMIKANSSQGAHGVSHSKPSPLMTVPRPQAKEAETPPAPIVFADACEPVATADLKHGQCRYPTTDESPWLHCGREAETVWCDAHKRVVFQPQKRAS